MTVQFGEVLQNNLLDLRCSTADVDIMELLL